MSSNNRKLYLESGKSFPEMMKAPVRYLKESLQVESVFEKPYRDEDFEYRKMHLNIPKPSWPTWDLSYSFERRRLRLPKLRDIEISTESSCKYCILICYPPPDGNCDDVITCRAVHACSHDMHCGDCKWQVTGDYEKVEKVSQTEIEITILDEGLPAGSKALINVLFVDGLGHKCFEVIEIACVECDCATADPFTWSNAPPDTLDPGGEATFTVTGGCPPYTYAIAGDGFSLGIVGESSGYVNTVYLALDTCGPSHNDAVGKITVTDACSSSITKLIRNTDGQWTSAGSIQACESGVKWSTKCINCVESSYGCSFSPPADEISEIGDDWTKFVFGASCVKSPVPDTCTIGNFSWEVYGAGGSCNGPPTRQPSCSPASCSSASCGNCILPPPYDGCLTTTAQVYIWTC